MAAIARPRARRSSPPSRPSTTYARQLGTGAASWRTSSRHSPHGSMVPGRLGADLILLGAGRSSRMGMPKGLIEVNGRRWVEHQIDRVMNAGMTRVVVILGADVGAYLTALPSLASLAEVSVNPDPDRGPFSSLQVGLARLADGVSVRNPVFVLPIDVPARQSPPTWSALRRCSSGEHRCRRPDVRRTRRPSRGSHPLLRRPFARSTRRIAPSTSSCDSQPSAWRASP